MIYFLNEMILWWHWVVFGIFLVIVELSIGTFFILGLGVSAIIVGILVSFLGLSSASGLALWILFSIVTMILWFKYYKEPILSPMGQSNSGFDIMGTVTKEIKAKARGEVMFDAPLLGSTIWHATSKENIEIGTRVSITDINGQLIVVEKNK